jgi:DNA segregation ATPase FtsK/SpoIIIE, S-DNA-T family
MPTANDPLDPGATLGLLDQLEHAAAAYAAREDELNRDHQARLLAARREAERGAGTAGESAAIAVAAAMARHEAAAAAAEAAYAARRETINRAFHSSRALMTRRAEEMKGQTVGRSQNQLMRAKHALTLQINEAEARRDDFARLCDTHHAGLAAARRCASRALRTFPWALPRLGPQTADAPAGPALEPADEAAAEEQLAARVAEAAAAAGSCRRALLPALFRWLPLSLVVLVILGFHAWMALAGGDAARGWAALWPSLAAWLGGVLALYVLAWLQCAGSFKRLATALAAGREREAALRASGEARVNELLKRMQEREAAHRKSLLATTRDAEAEAGLWLAETRAKLDAQLARLPARAEALHRRRLARLEAELRDATGDAHARAQASAEREQAGRAAAVDEANQAHAAALDEVVAGWDHEVGPLLARLASLDELAATRRPPFDPPWIAAWNPPAEALPALPLGRVASLLADPAAKRPRDPRLALPESPGAPLALAFPRHGSLLLETDGEAAGAAAEALNLVILRLLASFPPGRLRFTIIDPVGLGKNFAGVMHLADYEETLINHRIWTQPAQIEERLAELNEHVEKVIQMYLRNEFETIVDYNEQAGTIAERFHFLVIAGFPASISETAARRLLSLATSGGRCGVHLLIQRDRRLAAPDPALDEELRLACMVVRALPGGGFALADGPRARPLVFDAVPGDEAATAFVHRAGRASIDSNRVEVPFGQIMPAAAADRPHRRPQMADARPRQGHAPARAGRRQDRLRQIDPVSRDHHQPRPVVLARRGRVLPGGLQEGRRVQVLRGGACRTRGSWRSRATASSAQRAATGGRRAQAPRRVVPQGRGPGPGGLRAPPAAAPDAAHLLLIDEFQEFFTEDDPVAQEASLLLDRIVRQGRPSAST